MTATAPKPKTWSNAASDEWYTPASIVERARKVLGSIDLDPASSDAAQAIVQARTYYTAESNGLVQPWAGRVWLNPPFARGLVGAFVERLLAEHDAGNVEAAIVLVNLWRTGSAWFQKLATRGHRCELRRRITFWGPDGSRAKHDDVLFYLGPEPRRFVRVFADLGVILPPALSVTSRCACGRALAGERSTLRYCSPACRQRAYRARTALDQQSRTYANRALEASLQDDPGLRFKGSDDLGHVPDHEVLR